MMPAEKKVRVETGSNSRGKGWQFKVPRATTAIKNILQSSGRFWLAGGDKMNLIYVEQKREGAVN